MHLPPDLRSFDWITPWRGRLPAVAEVTLLSLLALQVARLAWLVLTPSGPIGTAAPAIATTYPAPGPLPAVDVFFRSTAAPSSGSDEALGYSLFGVRRGVAGGSAILGNDGDQASYAVGREIVPGIVLESVGAGHAVLAANGARYRLDLPRLGAQGGGRSTPGALPVGAPPSRPAVVAPGAAGSRPATPSTVTPPSAGGGYAITAGADAALLGPAGLRPGDVLLSVDGRPLDAARLGGLQDELKDRAQVTLQYRRDGKTRTTTLQAPR